jgi:DeoR family transcriptional regulator, glycerol-3-phosphate regulon repressor
MLAEQRHGLILALLAKRGSMSVTELHRRLKVSRETIRRDIALLAGRNGLRKTHGGALSVETVEPPIALRQVTNAAGKRAIGLCAAQLVPDGASVIISSGTTTQYVAEALTHHSSLTVFTNDLASCGKLAGRNGNRVFMLGGEVGINGGAFGPDTLAMLANYFADFAFIGAGAVSATPWLMDFSREEGELHSVILNSARVTAVVADHGKFNRLAPVRIRNFEKVQYLITDATPNQEIIGALKPLSIELLIATDNEQ